MKTKLLRNRKTAVETALRTSEDARCFRIVRDSSGPDWLNTEPDRLWSAELRSGKACLLSEQDPPAAWTLLN